MPCRIGHWRCQEQGRVRHDQDQGRCLSKGEELGVRLCHFIVFIAETFRCSPLCRSLRRRLQGLCTCPPQVDNPLAVGFFGVSHTPSQTPDSHATGDPHFRNVMGEDFDLWKTGWSSFLPVPQHFDEAEPQRLLHGLVGRIGRDECAPAFLQQLFVSGERSRHNVLVASRSLATS